MASRRNLSNLNASSFWMPFTHNRGKKRTRLFFTAKDMHYYDEQGKSYLDSAAGLWCVNAGHGNRRVSEAIAKQAAAMDYCPSFNVSHPGAFTFASRVLDVLGLRDVGLGKVFFTNSGSEAVDSALKIALAYHRARGEGTRTRFIGREKAYHGTGGGGMSVGGIPGNRAQFGAMMMSGVDHLPSPYLPEQSAFTMGQPERGLYLADELERIIALHGAANVAGVIVEPVAGSGGVFVPPKGYLRRLKDICDRHGVLLIFDEVITAFGRLGTATCGAKFFDVTPDLMAVAKGITNGAVPCGAVIAKDTIYQAMMDAADAVPGSTIELFHGYTYSGHPLAMAAGHAVLDAYTLDGIWENAAAMVPYFQEGIHSLRHASPLVSDVRGLGLMGGIDILPDEEAKPGKGQAPTAAPGPSRIARVFAAAADAGLLLRVNAGTVQLTPPLILKREHVDEIVEKLAEAIRGSE